MNVPMCIPCADKFEVRGEGVISWAHFEKLNLSLSEPYSHPRNLAAGSVRMLDARESGKRYLEFFAFDLISDSIEEHSKAAQLQFLAENGFDVVPYVYTDTHDVDELRELIADFKPAEYSQRDLSLPPEEDHADSVSSLSMTVSQLLLRRNLGYDWECLHLAEDSFWVLGVRDTPETDDFIKIGSQRFPLGELKNRQEVLEHLRENGASHRALMDICGEYMEKYQNELCWYYPTTDELHLGTFLLLVKEGVLSLPFNEVDSVDYELFCLEDACLCDAASINLLIADWYRFDSDLRHAMEGMRRYYEKKEAVGNENKTVSDRP